MHSQTIQIRQLRQDDATLFREIRLEALKANPEAFGSSFEVEEAKPLDWFAEGLSNSDVFGAIGGAELLGMAGLAVQKSPKLTHKGMLWGMYVRPAARGAGVGRQLAEAVVERARKKVELLQLTVVSENTPARRLYVALGFVEYGLEHHGLKIGGRYYDEVLMARDLKSPLP
jgi:ribosomal protein S18 acetylase RimI-like enzyme